MSAASQLSEAVFLDTQYLLALLNPDDAWHRRAVAAARRLEGPCTTSDAVLLELSGALCRRRHRALAVRAIRELTGDPDVACVEVDRQLWQRGFDLYASRRDKDWSLTDCISFVVMEERGLEVALTADRHFEQAGFRAALLDPSLDEG